VTQIVFDLAEVILSGIPGVEVPLGEVFSVPAETVLPGMAGQIMDDYCRGLKSEGRFWEETCNRNAWSGRIDEAQRVLRENLHVKIPGTEDILRELAAKGNATYLLSDHGREWVDYMLGVHDFFEVFDRRFFSFEFGSIKSEQITFRKLLSEIGSPRPAEVVFIDDNARNIGTAKSLGIDAIRFTGADQLREELESRQIL
jgi:HAD superfamily hydrolase (TIGR01509 family)